MRMRRTLAYLVFASCVLVFVVKNRAADIRSGDWTIRKSDEAGKVEFSLISHHHGGTSSHESDWPASSFQGVDFSKAGRQNVHFTIARDAPSGARDIALKNADGGAGGCTACFTINAAPTLSSVAPTTRACSATASRSCSSSSPPPSRTRSSDCG